MMSSGQTTAQTPVLSQVSLSMVIGMAVSTGKTGPPES
jgi:hypothetical protein